MGALMVAESLELLGVIMNSSTLKLQSCAISPFWWLTTSMGCVVENSDSSSCSWGCVGCCDCGLELSVLDEFANDVTRFTPSSSGRISSIESNPPPLFCALSPNISCIMEPPCIVCELLRYSGKTFPCAFITSAREEETVVMSRCTTTICPLPFPPLRLAAVEAVYT